jgi:hypothetical protein
MLMVRKRAMSNEWLKEYAPWVAAVVAPVTVWLGTRKKVATDADISLRTDLRETEKYLRQQLREVEADNKTLRTENLELKNANMTLRAEFEDHKRDTAREIGQLKDQLQAALSAMDRDRRSGAHTQDDLTALTERVRVGEEHDAL